MSKLAKFIVRALLHELKMGAYTELYAGLSPDVKMEMSGGYVVPWGRMHPSSRKDLLDTSKSVEEGGMRRAAEFREWCEKVTVEYRLTGSICYNYITPFLELPFSII